MLQPTRTEVLLRILKESLRVSRCYTSIDELLVGIQETIVHLRDVKLPSTHSHMYFLFYLFVCNVVHELNPWAASAFGLYYCNITSDVNYIFWIHGVLHVEVGSYFAIQWFPA